jgi:hypothetical protein
MFDILYGTSRFCYQTRCECVFGGQITTFCKNREVKLCDHKSIPVGFFMNDRSMPEDASIVRDTYTVVLAMGMGEYITNIYEPGDYKINDMLYCSPYGKITNNPEFIGNPTVGIVNNVWDDKIGFITCFTNLESISRFKNKG